MLKPTYLESVPDKLVELYAEVEADILADMVKRITVYMNFIPAAEYQYKKLIDMGLLNEEILKKLSAISGLRVKELERIMRESGVKAIKTDVDIYKKAGLNPKPLDASPNLQAVLKSGLDNTNGLFDNLTRTTANTATKQFEHALDRAWLQINTGAFSPQEAIILAIKDLAGKGIAVIRYPTGHTDYMETAVRRAVVTGVNQAALKMQDRLADEMGCDLVEVTAHAGARVGEGVANHAAWQGKIYSRSGTHPKYPDFVQSTGYGTGEGLGGWNCRHSFFPYFEGMEPAYTKEELKELNAKKYEYNGQKLTEYEASQLQRNIERNIRRWKREFKAMAAAGLPTDDAAAKIRSWQERQRDFIKQTGLKRQYDRENTVGFGKSEASKVSAFQKKQISAFTEQHMESVTADTLQNTLGDDIIKNTKKFSNRNVADKMFRPWTEEAWSTLSADEKFAAYRYTQGSGIFNRPLRGYDKSWDESAFKGVGNVPLDNEGGEQYIKNLMTAIDRSEFK
ncbi:MAG TPA: phage minor capsid protein, partial [Clostridia bacterium]|nr:phage minor capsid protein [Clostridia bacterium]